MPWLIDIERLDEWCLHAPESGVSIGSGFAWCSLRGESYRCEIASSVRCWCAARKKGYCTWAGPKSMVLGGVP